MLQLVKMKSSLENLCYSAIAFAQQQLFFSKNCKTAKNISKPLCQPGSDEKEQLNISLNISTSPDVQKLIAFTEADLTEQMQRFAH